MRELPGTILLLQNSDLDELMIRGIAILYLSELR